MPKIVMTLSQDQYDLFEAAAKGALLPTATWARMELLRPLVARAAQLAPLTKSPDKEKLCPGRLGGERLDVYQRRIRVEAEAAKETERRNDIWRALTDDELRAGGHIRLMEWNTGRDLTFVPRWLLDERGLMVHVDHRGHTIVVPKPTDENGAVIE